MWLCSLVRKTHHEVGGLANLWIWFFSPKVIDALSLKLYSNLVIVGNLLYFKAFQMYTY